MTDRIARRRNDCLAGVHKSIRTAVDPTIAERFRNPAESYPVRTGRRFVCQMESERPIVEPDDRIVFRRTAVSMPELCSAEELAELRKNHFIHERGNVSNICPDYAGLIGRGLESVLAEIGESDDEISIVWRAEISALLDLSDRYRAQAERVGNRYVAQMLAKIPRQRATTFGEALQFFRILHYAVWAEGEYHCIVGRLDQYLYPYLKADLESGLLSMDQALELLEEFFITFNLDSDLYPGMQQGDDGQSIVLGAMTRRVETSIIRFPSFA